MVICYTSTIDVKCTVIVYIYSTIYNNMLLEFFVDDVEAEAVPGPLHLGEEVDNLLDGLHLLLEELALQEVGELRVVVGASHLMHGQQGSVHRPFQLEAGLDGLHGGAPLVRRGLAYLLEHDPSAALVLVGDEFFGVFTLFVASLAEPFGKPWKSNVVAVKVGGHGEVGVRGVQLHVDLLVDETLRFSVEVLLHL